MITFSVKLLYFHQLFVVSGADDLNEGLFICSQALKHQNTTLVPPENGGGSKALLHLHGGFEFSRVVLNRALHQPQHQRLQRARQRPLQGCDQILETDQKSPSVVMETCGVLAEEGTLQTFLANRSYSKAMSRRCS